MGKNKKSKGKYMFKFELALLKSVAVKSITNSFGSLELLWETILKLTQKKIKNPQQELFNL